jgi:hypothetical protein
VVLVYMIYFAPKLGITRLNEAKEQFLRTGRSAAPPRFLHRVTPLLSRPST